MGREVGRWILTGLKSVGEGCWGLILDTAMPWRVVLLLCAASLAGYGATSLVLRLILLPEFLLTTRLRRWGWRPIPGTHAFGRVIWWAMWLLFALLCATLVMVVLSVIGWYALPILSGTIADFVSRFFEWWSSLGAVPRS